MQKHSITTAILLAIASAHTAFAETVPDSKTFSAVEPGRNIAGGTAYDMQPGKDAIDVATAVYRKTGFIRPIKNKDRSISFPFGAYPARIAVAPFHMTDIELQEGEQVADIGNGAAGQFTIDVVKTTPQHVTIKPQFLGPETNIAIYTTRRTYHIDLVTLKSGNYVPAVKFFYPNEPHQAYMQADELANAYKQNKPAPAADRCAPEKDTKAEYWWKGDGLHPIHVADDTTGHTYILMPPAMQAGEAGSVAVVRDGVDEQVNYRLFNGCYKVDAIADHFALIVGDNRVDIHKGKRGFWQ